MATRSIITAVAAGLLFSITASAQTYKDPQQRFNLDVPEGWMAEPFGTGVKIARGAAYYLVTDGSGENPEALVDRLAGQFGGQWTKFQQLKRGTATVAGQPAPFSFHSGVNPKGVPSFLKVLVVPSHGRTFALIGSAPERDFLEVKAGFDQVEQSFRVNVRAVSQHRVQTPSVAGEAGTRLGAVEHAPKALAGVLRKGFILGGRKSAAGAKSGVDMIRGR